MVDSVTGTALSGLQASSTRIQVAADNIANASTPNYKTVAVRQTTDPTGDVKTDVVKTNTAPNIDEQLVNVDTASVEFQANLKVLRAQQDMSTHLFDIQA